MPSKSNQSVLDLWRVKRQMTDPIDAQIRAARVRVRELTSELFLAQSDLLSLVEQRIAPAPSVVQKEANTEPAMLRLGKAAAKLDCSVKHLSRQIDAGHIRAVKLGAAVYVPTEEINRVLSGSVEGGV
jgi:hypothetical protein